MFPKPEKKPKRRRGLTSADRLLQRRIAVPGSSSVQQRGFGGPQETTLVSDFLLVEVKGEGWLPFRDVFERDGKKYGIDPQYIHLGKFSIPTALLGLLPLNAQANPVLAERYKASAQLNSDIRSQAQRGMNEADFKKAVRSIRERKEREKAAAAAAGDKKRPADSPPAVQATPDRG